MPSPEWGRRTFRRFDGLDALEHSWNLDAAGDLLELGLHLLVGLLDALVYRGAHAGEHEVRLLGDERLLVDLDPLHAAAERDDHFDLAAQTLHRQLAVLELTFGLIDLALHARRLAHQLAHSAAKLHDELCSLFVRLRQLDVADLSAEDTDGLAHDRVALDGRSRRRDLAGASFGLDGRYGPRAGPRLRRDVGADLLPSTHPPPPRPCPS